MKTLLQSGSMSEELVIEDTHLAGVMQPDYSTGFAVLTDQQILQAIDTPIGCGRLEDRVSPASQITIVVDDATRPTPSAKILAILLDKLDGLGVQKAQTRIHIATGLHRDPTEAEIERILGTKVLGDYTFSINDARNAETNTFVGTVGSKEIHVNSVVAGADLVITIGMVKSHAFAGFTGGAKSILPGCSSRRTIHENHCFSNIEYPNSCLGSCELSTSRQEMEAAARLIDPFIINVVLDADKNIIFASSGDVIAAHRAAVEFYEPIASQEIEGFIDIAFISGGLVGGINFYQALFGFNVVKTTKRPILKHKGIVILYAECSEGSGSALFEQKMSEFDTPEEILDNLENGESYDDQWAVQFLATVVRDMNVYVVSSGISPEVARKLKIRRFDTAAEAYAEAVAQSPKDYRVGLIENPDVLVLNRSV